MQILFEDNHLIAVYKEAGQIVQGDKTGDKPLSEMVADYLVVKHQKPGKAFIGVVHRLDRPVEGIILFAKTSKALSRMNKLFRENEVHKRYLAIVNAPPRIPDGILRQNLYRNTTLNKSFVVDKNHPNSKEAILRFHTVGRSDRYTLLSVSLITGRHHQIRCQLASLGASIRGDLKYGAPRSNKNGGISLLAYEIRFTHPVSKEEILLRAPLPKEPLWQAFSHQIASDDKRLDF